MRRRLFVFLLFVNHIWLLHGIGGIAIRDLWSETVPPLLACIPLAVSGFALVELFDRAPAPAIATLAATVLLGLVVYGLVLHLAFPASGRCSGVPSSECWGWRRHARSGGEDRPANGARRLGVL
jgi:hypothetical protein